VAPGFTIAGRPSPITSHVEQDGGDPVE